MFSFSLDLGQLEYTAILFPQQSNGFQISSQLSCFCQLSSTSAFFFQRQPSKVSPEEVKREEIEHAVI